MTDEGASVWRIWLFVLSGAPSSAPWGHLPPCGGKVFVLLLGHDLSVLLFIFLQVALHGNTELHIDGAALPFQLGPPPHPALPPGLRSQIWSNRKRDFHRSVNVSFDLWRYDYSPTTAAQRSHSAPPGHRPGGGPGFHCTCSGGMDPPCAKVLPAAKRLYAPDGAAPLSRGPSCA